MFAGRYDARMSTTPSVPQSPSAALAQLYPPIEPFKSGMLDVGDGHLVY